MARGNGPEGHYQGVPEFISVGKRFAAEHKRYKRPKVFNWVHIGAAGGPVVCVKQANVVSIQPRPRASAAVDRSTILLELVARCSVGEGGGRR